MKNKKFLALLLVVVLAVTQFAMLGTISAAETDNTAAAALSGRNGFALGVTVHSYYGYDAYKNTAQVISDAGALGSDIIRTNIVADNMAYNVSVADMAAKKGMQVMAVAGFDYYDNTANAPINAANIDVEGITAYFTSLATSLKGKVAYYQINNEMCNKMLKSSIYGDSTSANRFKDVSGITVGLNAAYDAIKAVDPDAKVVVNFCWTHYGFLKALKAANAKWDVTGLDWYYTNEEAPTYYNTVINAVVNEFNKPVIVCEANVKPTGYGSNGNVTYNNNAAWLGRFASDCYANENVEGFIAYELYDQPAFENEGFNEQAHFGLIDKDGNKKDTYNTLCALYGGTGEDTAWYSPEMVASEGQLLFKEGETFAGSYGKEAISEAWMPRYNASVCATPDNAETDFTEYDYIEFDYYVEDIDALKTKVSDLTVGIMHYSGGAAESFSYLSKLTKNGWNHIKVAIDVSSARKWVIERATQVRFRVTTTDSVAGSTDPYIISNVRVTKSEYDIVPNMVNAAKRYDIYAGVAYNDTFGANAITGQGNPPRGRSEVYLNDSVLANYDYIELDFYVDDIDNFKARNTRMYLNLRKDKAGTHRSTIEYTSQITKSGWNHIKISINPLFDNSGNSYSVSDINGIRTVRFYMDIDASESGATDRMRFANVCATMYSNSANFVPEMPQSPDRFDINVGIAFDETFGSNAITGKGDFPSGRAQFYPSDLKLADYGYIEFDFYVDDIDNFNARNTKMYLNLRKGQSGTHRSTIEYTSQITKSGWNHIKLSVKPLYADNGSSYSDSDINGIGTVRFYIDIDAGETGATDRFKIANVCATKPEYDLVPEMPEALERYDIYAGVAYNDTFGANEITGQGNPPRGRSEVYLNDSVLANYDYIELDFYVDDIDNFKARNTRMYLNLRKDKAGTHRSTIEYTSQITKSGWNHIKISINPLFDNSGNSYSVSDINGIRTVRFYMDIDASESGATDRMRFANVCATKQLSAPTDVMSEKVDLLDTDVKYATLDENGNSRITLKTAKDVTDTKMIELDVYLFSADGATVVFAINDSNNNTATYEFKGLTQGWNHLAVRISDLIKNGNINFADICGFSLNGTANVQIAVANAYAADYIEGDANRDGVLDARDIVRAKKIAVGITTKGNILAISGEDYLVNASDIANLRVMLLSK